MEYKKKNGEVVGAVPYGYRRCGKELLPDVAEQRTIRNVNQMYSQGRTLCQTVKTLNEEGQLTRQGNALTPYSGQAPNFGSYRQIEKIKKKKITKKTRQSCDSLAQTGRMGECCELGNGQENHSARWFIG